jgi:acyl carrier protein
MRLIGRIEDEFGKALSLVTVFDAPTIGELVALINDESFTLP